MVRIELASSVQVWSDAAAPALIRGKKARAVIALAALSHSRSVLRQAAAATLWSSVERATGLARLRDVVHNLRRGFEEAGLDVLDADNDTIRIRSGTVVDVAWVQDESGADRWSRFLTELENIDPSMDRWLTHVRAERRQQDISTGFSKRLPSNGALKEDRPTILVTELQGDGLDAAFAAALTSEIGAALARLRWFSTISRTARGARLQAGRTDLTKLGDYALIGTVESDDEGHRLLLKLIDLRALGAIRWASSFKQERQPGLFSREQLANAVAARLDTELLLIEVERQRRQTSSRRDSAYSLVMQAVPGIYRLERTTFLQAGHLLEQAVMVDTESAFAHSWLAYWLIFLVGQGWASKPFQSMRQAGWASDRTMMLDPKDARGVTIAGHVKAFLHRRLDEALTLHELAIQLNPAMALAWHLTGMTHAYAGRLDEAHRCISHCRALAPTDPLGFFAEGALGIVYLLQHDHERAMLLGRRVTERHPTFTSALKSYLAVLGHLGQRAEAARILQRLLTLEPRFSLQRFHNTAPYQRPRDLEHFTAGLRLAGVA